MAIAQHSCTKMADFKGDYFIIEVKCLGSVFSDVKFKIMQSFDRKLFCARVLISANKVFFIEGSRYCVCGADTRFYIGCFTPLSSP